ncbi:MAG: hypothetical protein JNJ57_04245, partial [Saprospiraceae bacterium]|nr:hypothetical protein [Saprospiraceae bacterium]
EDSSDSYYFSAALNAYYIQASNNELLRVRMYFHSPDPEWRLKIHRPDGSLYGLLEMNGSGLIDTTLQLTAGNWFFYIYDEGADETNTTHYVYYDFQSLQKTTCAEQVTCSDYSSDSYYYPAAINAYYVQASNNDSLWLRMYFQSPDPEWRVEVRRPNGTLWGVLEHDGSGLLDTMIALSNGSWFFYVYDEGGDEPNTTYNYNYQFLIINKTTCADQLNCNENSSDSYYYSATVKPYYLTVSDNDKARIRFDFQSPDPEWRVQIRRPNGTVFGTLAHDGSGLLDTVLTLSPAGNWYFYVYDEDGDEPTTTRNYTYSFQVLQKTTCADLVDGDEDSSDSYYFSAALNAYYIQASNNDLLRIRFYFLHPDPEWRIEIRRPNGTVWGVLQQNGTGLIDTIIPLSQGNWFFYVYDQDGDEPNTTHNYNYTFQFLQKTTVSDQVTCTEDSYDSYYYSTAVNAYYITSTGDETLKFRAYFGHSDPEWRMEIRRPDGSIYDTLYRDGIGLLQADIHLNIPGNWFFYVYDEGGDEPNTTHPYHYAFQLMKQSCATNITCGGYQTANTYYPAEIDGYSFVAEACDTVRISVIGSDPAFHECVWLYSPDGQLVDFQAVSNNSSNVSLTAVLDQFGDGRYVFVVGETEGDQSGAYSVQVYCNSPYLSANNAAYNVSAVGGDQMVPISSDCYSWSVSENVNWLSVTNSTGGYNGTATITYLSNLTTSPRSATLLLIGCCDTSIVNFTQAGATLNAAPTTINLTPLSGQTTFDVSSTTCMDWSVSTNAAWIESIQPASGAGNQSITVVYQANQTASSRSATVTITGCGMTRTVTLTQQGVTLIVSPGTLSVSEDAGQTSFDLFSGCFTWTVTSSAPWLTVSPAAGGGNNTIQVFYERNCSASSRSGTITITGCGLTRTVTVSQSGAELAVSQSQFTVLPQAGFVSVNVSGSCCAWTASSSQNWVTISPGQGTMPGTVTISYEPNTGADARTATIVISGCGITRTITLTQQGDAILTASVSQLNLGAAAGQVAFQVFSNCTWTVSDGGANWLFVTPTSGSNNGTVTVFYNANNQPFTQTATLTLSGCGINYTIQVSQAANEIIIVSPNLLTATNAGGSMTFDVGGNCGSWTVVSSEPWVTVSPAGGTGNATVYVVVTANATNVQRTATITVSGCGNTAVVTVVQQGNVFLYSSTSSIGVGSSAGEITFELFTNCNDWEVIDNGGWLFVLPGSGNGNATLTVYYNENNTSNLRNATITISGCNLTYTINFTQGTVANNEVETISKLSVVPNPAAESFEVEIPETYSSGALNVFNATGMLVRQIDVPAPGRLRVHRDELPNGFYLLQLRSTDQSLIAKAKLILSK